MCNCVHHHPRDNRFAVARTRAGTVPGEQARTDAADDAVDAEALARLGECEERAWANWLRLFREPDCWSDPQKRATMLRARREYQDASVARAEASCGRPY